MRDALEHRPRRGSRSYMIRALPAPVRVLYPVLIDRPWKKYAATLRSGT